MAVSNILVTWVSLLLVVAVTLGAAAKDQQKTNKAEKLFLANYATSTELRISISTTTIPYTCFLFLSKISCTGRSARFHKNRDHLSSVFRSAHEESNTNLDSSQEDSSAASSINTPDGKNFFTVWSVVYTTATVTTTYVNTAVSVKVSAMCIPDGSTVPPTC